jgi:transcription antitermination factor NusG
MQGVGGKEMQGVGGKEMQRVKRGLRKYWYVLYTSARAEKRAEERLKETGVETFLPLHRVKRKWSDRVKVVEQPLFFSYIFVNCDDYKLRQLPFVYGVSRIVYYNGRPAVVRENEINAIKEFLDIAKHREIISNGDEVEILCGPLKSKSGKVIEVNDKYAKLTIEELGAKICVSLLELNKTK